MSLKKKVLALMLVCMAVFCLAGCGSQTAMIVNGEKVPQAVVDYYIAAGSQSLAAYGIDTESKQGAQYLAMIEEQAVTNAEQLALVRSGAIERGLEVTSEEVDEEFEKEKEAFADKDAYNEFLEKNELEESTIKWIIESQLYYQALFDDLNKDLTATDEELKAAYEADPTAFDTVKVSYILVQPEDTTSDDSWAEAETKAKEVITKLNDGGDFAELAKEYSADTATKDNGGVLDDAFTAQSEAYVPEFVSAAFGLQEVGSYTTEPVKNDSYGYFVIKLDEKVTGWENLKDEITDSLLGDQKNENFNTFMQDAMDNAVYDKEYKYKYAVEEDDSADNTDSTDNTDNADNADNSADNAGASADDTAAQTDSADNADSADSGQADQ